MDIKLINSSKEMMFRLILEDSCNFSLEMLMENNGIKYFLIFSCKVYLLLWYYFFIRLFTISNFDFYSLNNLNSLDLSDSVKFFSFNSKIKLFKLTLASFSSFVNDSTDFDKIFLSLSNWFSLSCNYLFSFDNSCIFYSWPWLL